jgi:hypothetical protein
MNKLLENLQSAELEIDHAIFDYSEFNWAIHDDIVFWSNDKNVWPEDLHKTVWTHYYDFDENITVEHFCRNDDGLVIFSGKDLTMFIDKNENDTFDCMVFDNSKRVK